MTGMQLDLGREAALVIPVSDLNRRVRTLLENHFEMVWVAGELSNVKQAPSGHWYFCLKDPGAQVECAMFRKRAQFLDFRPENGQRVEVRARVTLYEPRGNYQLVIEEIRKAGLGALYEAFEKLKARLAAEGLFETGRKKPLPRFPRAIGLVTSPSAAALRDVVTTLRRRAGMIPLVLYPTLVQGEGAAAQIARAIQRANAHGACDVLIVCRGGGSLEDLWAYNEEVVARAIAASRLPIVSGVGHETDFSIADFVADLRAATPTAAAVAASPEREALRAEVVAYRRRLARDLRRIVEVRMQRLDSASRRLLTPAERIARNRERLVQSLRRLQRALGGDLRHKAQRLAGLRTALAHLDPTQVLGRGYSIVRDSHGHVRRTSAGLSPGEPLDVTFSEGGAAVRVERTR
jgi:exodeoxyribonuclease VII large subunit